MNKTFLFAATLAALTACNNDDTQGGTNGADTAQASGASAAPRLREEAVTYTADSITANGFVVWNEAVEGPRPAVLVVHEWWGVNDYVKERARQLASLGYIAMAVDMFGGGRNAANPDEAMQLAGPFYQNPGLAYSRLQAAAGKLRTYAQADSARMGAIGYCFGGFVVLNAAKLGAPLDGVVSFHGGLAGAPVDKSKLTANVLVCHGGADPFVPEAEVAAFRKSMDSVGAPYQFKVYADATHAFTNPNATETGQRFNMPIRYNPAADSASWADMKSFFNGVLK